MKLITVVIPAYNTEKYLSRCIDSLVYDADILDKLDIIIVNDGSTDGTKEVAQNYVERWPEAVRLIDKQNGGHGSTINAGITKAKGKYFRVVDSDDWVNIDDFGDYVSFLGKTEADIVLSNYQEDHLYDSKRVPFSFGSSRDTKMAGEKIETAANSINEPDFFFKFSMHSIAVKTKALKRVWGDGLLEHTFYVDQQYVAKALEAAKDYLVSNYDVYRYFIGRPEQSVGMEGFWRHRRDHEKVLRWLLKEQTEMEKDNPVKTILQKQIVLMLGTHFEIYYQRFDALQDEIQEILDFNHFLQTEFPEIHQKVPAAQRVSKRLSPIRRKIKQKFYANKGVAHEEKTWLCD